VAGTSPRDRFPVARHCAPSPGFARRGRDCAHPGAGSPRGAPQCGRRRRRARPPRCSSPVLWTVEWHLHLVSGEACGMAILGHFDAVPQVCETAPGIRQEKGPLVARNPSPASGHAVVPTVIPAIRTLEDGLLERYCSIAGVYTLRVHVDRQAFPAVSPLGYGDKRAVHNRGSSRRACCALARRTLWGSGSVGTATPRVPPGPPLYIY